MLDKLTAISNASFLGKLLRLPFRLMPDSATLPVLSGINRGMKWVAGSATHGAWLGTYESDKQQQLARLLKSGMAFYDVGANAGFYTLAAARLVGERGHVFAFEPLAENVANLRRHVQLNQLQNVSIIQAAVCGYPESLGFQHRVEQSHG
ncbi:MAG: FkbM family methyltransferase [Burkholderiales bacterium]